MSPGDSEAVVLELHMPGIDDDAIHRAHHRALRLIEVADALGASRRIDLIDLCALRDGQIRTLRLAYVAVDAFVGDE